MLESQKYFLFRTVERKYQEQIKGLQSQLDDEREQYTTHTAKLKSKIHTEMESLKQEEGRLRDNLAQAQKVGRHSIVNDL